MANTPRTKIYYCLPMKSSIIEKLLAKNVLIPAPHQVYIDDDVCPDNIEPEAVIMPGVVIQGSQTLIGRKTRLGPGGYFVDVRCGRQVKLATGHYDNCVFLDYSEARSGAEIRGGTLFMEGSQAAHTVGCKMTILGIKVTLGSLINFCDIFVSGGSDEPFGFTEIGSGAIHYNFTPNALKFGSLIGPGAPGEMFGLFPRTFIGGQTQIIAPTLIGSQVLVAAGTAVRKPLADGIFAIAPPLPPGKKSYHPDLIAAAHSKFLITATLIAHYQVLAGYFTNVRLAYARCHQDDFAEKLCRQALSMIAANISERMDWLFNRSEGSQRCDFFSKLPQSLCLHQQALANAGAGKTRFLLEQVAEHQLLIARQHQLQQCLQQSLAPGEVPPDLDYRRRPAAANPGVSYLDWVKALEPASRQRGGAWLRELVSERCRAVETVLKRQRDSLEIRGHAAELAALLRPFFTRMAALFAHDKFLFSGNWSEPDLGLLNGTLDYHTDLEAFAWRLLATVPSHRLNREKIGWLIKAIEALEHPALIEWPPLLTVAMSAESQPQLTEMVARTCYRFHGTDGLRGTMKLPPAPCSLSQAIVSFCHERQVTPEFFEALVRNTIYARQVLMGQEIQAIAIARDPRDLYADDPQRCRLFYQAVQQGALSTGAQVYDLGIAPAPALPYLMAYWHARRHNPPIQLACYKSASHNPAAQDGIKVFIGASAGERFCCQKASARLEMTISALLFKEALGPTPPRRSGQLYPRETAALDVFAEVMRDQANWTSAPGVAFIVADLANGAFSQTEYAAIAEAMIRRTGSNELLFVGNQPDGRNINNNEGQQRVGAGHLENVYCISDENIAPGGKFYGFPALKALWEYGQTHQERLQRGEIAWAVFTDGDGDRSYVAYYDPFVQVLRLVDGDMAFYYQLRLALARQEITAGSVVAVTVESSVAFINAAISLLEKSCPVQLILGATAATVTDKINLRITPVGDKYILAASCPGAEASGHVIRSYRVAATSNDSINIFVGNGLMAGLNTIAAMAQTVFADASPGFRCQFKQLTAPYPAPYNTIVYIYFIRKNLWYRDSKLWQVVCREIVAACQPHRLQDVHFAAEPDTMYLVSFSDEQQMEFSILARPSGTENKFSIKFFGSDANREFFTSIADHLFIKVAPVVKDKQSRYCQEEMRILHLLQNRSQPASVADLYCELAGAKEAVPKAEFMAIIESLSDRCQKLADYDGNSLRISTRGRSLLQISSGKL